MWNPKLDGDRNTEDAEKMKLDITNLHPQVLVVLFIFDQCCQVKNLQIARMGSKYGRKWPNLGFINGQLNGQLSVLY